MKTAIITGVGGMDGALLAKLLLKKGYRVVGAKRRSSVINSQRIDDIYNHKNFQTEYFDLSDASSIHRLISIYKPNEYYNLAAQSHVRVSFDVPEDTMSGIINGTLYALEAIRTISPETHFYQASSSEQFGDNPDIPDFGFNEESRFMPASPYAIAKVSAHQLVRNYRISYGLHASCGILFNHEHTTRGETFVTRKISQAVARIKLGQQKTLILGNLDAMRDWGWAEDYVEAMWMMLQQDKSDDYVIATGEVHSVREFLEETFYYAGLGSYEKYVKFDKAYLRPQEVPYLLGDASKAERVLGWKPKKTFDEIVEMMYDADLKALQK